MSISLIIYVLRTFTASIFAGLLALSFIMSVAAMPSVHAQKQTDMMPYYYSPVKTIGSSRTGPGEFNGPAGLATDSSGNLYVVDSGNKRVQKVASNGSFLAMWNISDADPQSLVGIDLDSDGNIYVADFQEDIIRVLVANDTTSGERSGMASQDASLRSPFDIAIDPITNEAYVTAVGGIWKYAANGTLIEEFREKYKNDTRVELHHTTGVDIDSQGNVYVLAADNPIVNASFVQVFSSNGTFLGSWGGQPLKHPNDIAIDSSGTVFIRDADSKVKVFTKNGTFLSEWGSAEPGEEQLTGSVGIAFDPTDSNIVYLSDPGNSRVQKFTKDGNYISSIGLASSANGQFEVPYDIDFDSQGNMYVADAQNHRIQKFSPEGTFISKWGSYCELYSRIEDQSFCLDPDGAQGPLEKGDGQFSNPIDVAIDPHDNVYVLDGSDNMRIQKFTSNGTFITKFNISSENKTSDTDYISIIGIVVDSQGNVYAAVREAFPSIQKFSSSGTYIGGWNLHGPETIPLPSPSEIQPENMTQYLQDTISRPWQIAIDSADNIYVTATVDPYWNNYHVEKMSNNGTLIARWGQAGWCKDEFRDVRDMAFDSADNLHLLDASNKRISIFSSNGSLITLLYPEEDIGISNLEGMAIAFDSIDYLYLIKGNTITIFEPKSSELLLQQPLTTKEGNGSIETRYYYQTPVQIMEGFSTRVPTYSSDARVVCGQINTDEKTARFELLADNMHNDPEIPNTIELILPDEFISGIYQVRTDDGHEIPFEQWQLDNTKNISLLETLDLSSSRNYTIVSFTAPENASIVDIHATTVVPEFESVAPFVMAVAIVSVIVAKRFAK